MGRRPKYECILDKWMNDPKWRFQEPFMAGKLLCYEVVTGTGKNATFEHFMYDTTDKTYNDMICDGVPKSVIDFYKEWFNYGIIEGGY